MHRVESSNYKPKGLDRQDLSTIDNYLIFDYKKFWITKSQCAQLVIDNKLKIIASPVNEIDMHSDLKLSSLSY